MTNAISRAILTALPIATSMRGAVHGRSDLGHFLRKVTVATDVGVNDLIEDVVGRVTVEARLEHECVAGGAPSADRCGAGRGRGSVQLISATWLYF